ncbi:hypothetical protein E8Q33_11130 [Methylophaga sp. SB9B]|uniref:hypothetical protein n=1 Tax=Methylophaga sp. SB9B TaxID=2570356 RepID=UPI0010A8A687|nr:hypothetical protein [Methylophaga sp. SB9B]THK40841.1 hypothetical protein E8Q33_11130 [Methylophaga sp. SB9B]
MTISAYLANIRRWLFLMSGCITIVVLTGCEDDTPQQSLEFEEQQPSYAIVKPVPQNLQGGMPTAKPAEMLSVADPTPPEQWLLTLYLGKPDADETRDIGYYQKLLSSIKSHVHEQPRVIANRTVQTTRQLQEMGIEADEDQLLQDFADQLKTTTGRYVYGELCANYSNLRQQQLSHQQAMQDLLESL